MEKFGILHMPPMEPFVATHLHPWLMTASTRKPTLPSKADTMTERAYKGAALVVRVLNGSSMLMKLSCART